MAQYEGLEFTVSADIGKSASQIEKLSSALKNLKQTLSSFDSSTSTNLNSIVDALNKIDTGKANSIGKIGSSFKTASSGILNFNKAIKKVNLDTIDFKLQGLNNSIQSLDSSKLSNLATVMQKLGKVKSPKISLPQAKAQPKSKNIVGSEATDKSAVKVDGDMGTSEMISGGSKLSAFLGNLKGQFDSFGSTSKGIFSEIGKVGSVAWKGIKMGVSGVIAPIKNFHNKLQGLSAQLGRVAMNRAFRALIAHITQALQQGVQHVYNYASAVNDSFAPAMDRIATAGAYATNALGVMASPIIQSLAPAIDFIIDKFVALINIINQFFAFLGATLSFCNN